MRPLPSPFLVAWLAALAVPLLECRSEDASPLPAADLEREICASIEKGRKWLESNLSGSDTKRLRGELSLAAYAVLSAGGDPAREPLKGAIGRIVDAPLINTYEAGLVAMILAECADILEMKGQESVAESCRARIFSIAAQFIESQQNDGGWGYSVQPKRAWLKSHPGSRWGVDGNLSTTQYALLGLNACALSGARIPPEVWERSKRCFLRNQESGGWGYGTPGNPANGREPYGAMTAVGVASLIIIRERLKEERKPVQLVDHALEKGIGWLSDNYSVDTHPRFSRTRRIDFRNEEEWHLFYYLYSLERAMVFAQQDKIADHDWYVDGARFLVGRQEQDGRWRGSSTETERIATSFALLFLKRGSRTLAPYRPMRPYQMEGEKR